MTDQENTLLRTEDDQEKLNLTKLVEAKEQLKDTQPELYARLQSDERFRKLTLAQEPKRTELVRWFLNEVNKSKPKPFPRMREALSKN